MKKNRFGQYGITLLLGGILLFALSSVQASGQKILFGMQCETTRIPLSGTSQKTIFHPDNYQEELTPLLKKGYSRIDMIQEFTYGNTYIKVLLGEKCDHPVLRINGEESINDLGIDHLQKKGNFLLMYGAKDGYATMISCNLETLTGNTYIPFDTPTSKKSVFSGQIMTQSVIAGSLLLEKKTLHPQDRKQLLHQPVAEIIKFFGGNRKRDRQELAQRVGILEYRGTKTQNIQIRTYLLSYIDIDVVSTHTADIVVAENTYQAVQDDVVADLVNLRGYTWKYDRRGLFQEIEQDIASYEGTRTQNIKIRKFLLPKIKKK